MNGHSPHVLQVYFEHLIDQRQRDYLSPPPATLRRVRRAALDKLKPQLPRYDDIFALPARAAQHRDFCSAAVTIGTAAELDADARQTLWQHCHFFKPWKKGPWSLFGIDIDAEWRSDLKWQRLEKKLQDLHGKKIADIGCHNGYFMFRLSAYAPDVVVGFEPNPRCYFSFHFLQRYAQVENIYFEPFGFEHLDNYLAFFDLVLCLGVLYHHTDPVAVLRGIHRSLAKGGRVLIDCQGINSPTPTLLLPARRYAGAAGIWYLPSQQALAHWLQRTNFRHINFFYADYLSPSEQRRTAWADIDSLADFVCGERRTTVEGYPAPWRMYVEASK